jgi:RND family efflux transporter MFP subunit
MNRPYRLFAGLSVLLPALLLGACGAPHKSGAAGGTAVNAPTTVLAPAQASAYSESPGTVVATHRARIASRLSGYVHALDVDVGDRVTAGQLLLTIDNRDVEAQVAQAQAALSRARAAYADAAFNYRRYSNLYRQQAVSRQQYESVKRNYVTAQAGVSAARAGLAQAQAQRAYAEVRAPFAGVVTARPIEAGDLATPGKVLLVIQAPGHLEVHSQITNNAYAALAPGDQVEVTRGEMRLTATVQQLSPAADPATETHLLKAALPGGSGLGPGDFVRVRVPVGTYRALFVPNTAVVTRAGIPEVFVVDDSDHAHLRMVRLGTYRDGRTEILAGLTPGERIVTRPGNAVANGDLIRPALP